MGRSAVTAWTAAALLVLAGCGTDDDGADADPTTANPTPQQSISPTKLAVANLLLVEQITPAPPGSVVNTSGPVAARDVLGEPSRQVMTCTPLELTDQPGPAEPDAAGAASSSSVVGVAQVDQYVVVYTDEAAARRAVDRARERTENYDEAFAVHSPDAKAQAVITEAPDAVEGFRVHATYDYAGETSDEVSAVLQSGRTVLYLRANETGSGENADEEVDGTLDAAWVDQLMEAAASHLAE